MGCKFDEKTLVILTTSPAGLGHIRVMEALRSGLSAQTRMTVLGLSDPSIQWLHRLTSRNTFLRKTMEYIQENRWTERWFSRSYRKFLRTHTKGMEKKLAEIVLAEHECPETVVVVSTHFGLAHQLAVVKVRLMEKLGVKLVTAVIVTDDSPQEIWAVPGLDVIFVPSNTTREMVLSHLMWIGGPIPEVVTIPYPVSLKLAEQLSEEEYEERQVQLAGRNLEIILPVSGAAVQLEFFQDLIRTVTARQIRVAVVSRESAYTRKFIGWCRTQTDVRTLARVKDTEVVAAYEDEYIHRIIGAEVTKPSEQAFKALYKPRQRGGAVLLLSQPVGRQEKDNLAFLRRHRLMPSVDDQARLMSWCISGNKLMISEPLLTRARNWRAVMLPKDGVAAGIAIQRLMEAGILKAMAGFNGYIEGHNEIRCDGVKQVWGWLQDYLAE